MKVFSSLSFFCLCSAWKHILIYTVYLYRLHGHPNVTRAGDFHSGRISPPPQHLRPKNEPADGDGPPIMPAARHGDQTNIIDLSADDDDVKPPASRPSNRAKAAKNGGVPEERFESKDAKGQASLGTSMNNFMNATGKLVEVQTVAVAGRETRADKAQEFQIMREQYQVAKDILADPNASEEEKTAAQKVRLRFMAL